MPKVSAEHMQSRRDQIARAAISEFSVRGIHSTSMANIISASQLSAGAIYTHFTGKDDIIAYVSHTTIGGVFDGIKAALSSSSPLPSHAELLDMIAGGIERAAVSPSFIVQVWGEAATNPEVRATANSVYAEALSFLTKYTQRLLVATQRLSEAEATDLAPQQAAQLIDAIYGGILQTALIDGYVPRNGFHRLDTDQAR